jgi:hypothetical protein
LFYKQKKTKFTTSENPEQAKNGVKQVSPHGRKTNGEKGPYVHQEKGTLERGLSCISDIYKIAKKSFPGRRTAGKLFLKRV